MSDSVEKEVKAIIDESKDDHHKGTQFLHEVARSYLDATLHFKDIEKENALVKLLGKICGHCHDDFTPCYCNYNSD